MNYHQPVLLNESIEGLDIRTGKVYVDATFGGGGHSKAILERIGNGRLIAFDQDRAAGEKAVEITDKRFLFLKQNFRFLKNNLRYYKALPVGGILADLGVSSHQFDTAERGFSYRFDSALDMRMNQSLTLTASEVINKYPAEKMAEVFKKYGEIENANSLAHTIIKFREEKNIKTVKDFLSAIDRCVFKKKEQQYLSRVFQALRIEVNDEINALKDFLMQSLELLETGGKMVVISYHSLEDRLVKNFFKTGNFEGLQEKDFYGNVNRTWSITKAKVIVPSDEEIKNNPRSRSAKMRVAEKK